MGEMSIFQMNLFFSEYDDQNLFVNVLNDDQNNNFAIEDNQIVKEENKGGKFDNLLNALLNDEDLSE